MVMIIGIFLFFSAAHILFVFLYMRSVEKSLKAMDEKIYRIQASLNRD